MSVVLLSGSRYEFKISVCVSSLLWIWCDPFITVASQDLCESPILITSTSPTLVPGLEQPLCFGCFFLDTQAGTSFFIPLGTEWSVANSGVTTPLNNETDPGVVILSGTNGAILIGSPSSFLQFETSQLRCTYTTPTSNVLSFIATLANAGKSCMVLISQVTCITFWDIHIYIYMHHFMVNVIVVQLFIPCKFHLWCAWYLIRKSKITLKAILPYNFLYHFAMAYFICHA